MALNLNTLTSSATSGDVLAEALTTADFLEPVPVLRNLARGSQKGGDAKQGTALNQPKALPYDGKGYLYVSGVSGNYASVPNATNLNGITDFVMEAKDVYMGDWAASGAETFLAKYNTGQNGFVFARLQGTISFYAQYSGSGSGPTFAHGLTGAKTANIKLIRSGTSLTAQIDTGAGYVTIGSTATVPSGAIDTTTTPIEIGSYDGGGTSRLTGKIGQARIWKNATASGTPVLDVDFTATNVRHGDTKFKCATGQVVTVNQSGNDPATIIKKSVLRFVTAAGSSLRGQLNRTITDGGYYFAAFTINGDGGNTASRVFAINSTGQNETANTGFVYAIKKSSTNDLASYHIADYTLPHDDLYDDERGDILHQVKTLNNAQLSSVNGAAAITSSVSTSNLSAEEFGICCENNANQTSNPSLDLEFLALFPASITDDQADSVRNYINNRNNVFSLIGSQGYYFYNSQSAPVGAISSGSSAWNGRIVGSDNGDADKLATQATANDQPVSDGYVVTFADNSDHLDIPSTTQAGWQIVGTSLGTFAYRVDNDAVTELNLLGNLGSTSYRQAGDLYGVILLPESATGKDIEDARKLLIDRGAADAASVTSVQDFWRNRYDIVEFKHVNFTNVTNFLRAFRDADSINNFGAINAPNGNNFSGAWEGCDSLLSFPSGAKLGTSANNVNFTSAWQESGLESFPALDLSNGINMSYAFYNATSLSSFGAIDARGCANFFNAFNGCSALTSFSAGAKLGTEATNVNFTSAFFGCASLESLPAGLDLSQGNRFYLAFYGCTALTTVGNGVLLGTASSGVDFTQAFLNCVNLVTLPANLNLSKGDDFQSAFENCSSLVTFPSGAFDNMGTPLDYCFTNAWASTSALSATSVENILVSINTSGQSAPSTGPEITIKYNTATGTPAYSTLASLKSKGWVIKVNNVTL